MNRPARKADKEAFTFRLPDEYAEWVLKHAPKADSRGLRMKALVMAWINANPKFKPSKPLSEYDGLRQEFFGALEAMESRWSQYINALVKSGSISIDTLRSVNDDSEIEDDMINNILSGLDRE